MEKKTQILRWKTKKKTLKINLLTPLRKLLHERSNSKKPKSKQRTRHKNCFQTSKLILISQPFRFSFIPNLPLKIKTLTIPLILTKTLNTKPYTTSNKQQNSSIFRSKSSNTLSNNKITLWHLNKPNSSFTLQTWSQLFINLLRQKRLLQILTN